MLHKLLDQYLSDIDRTVRRIEGGYVERYDEEILATERVNLRIRIRFSNGFLLELNDAILMESGHIKHLCYRYHLQDGENKLVFRYDNTPHFPNIATFPNHKHLLDKTISCDEPSIVDVIEEAKQLTVS